MELNLDAVAGLLSGCLALFVFTLHILSSHRQRTWMKVPEYVRGGFLVTGAMMTWRSANFFSISMAPTDHVTGRINAEGMMALVSMTYLMGSFAVWMFLARIPGRGWERVEWVINHFRRQPDAVAVVVGPHELADIARSKGVATIEAREGGIEVFEREAGRASQSDAKA